MEDFLGSVGLLDEVQEEVREVQGLRGKIVAVTNQKGGVGKTTFTANLGAGLVRMGKKVLLVDADPQSHLTTTLARGQKDGLTLLMNGEIEGEDIDIRGQIYHCSTGVDLITSSEELAAVEASLVNAIGREYNLRSILTKIRRDYDVVLIDCAPSLGMITINALTAADSVIVPVQPQYLSVKGLGMLMKAVEKVRKKINPELKVEGIVFSMVDDRTNHARSMIKLAEESYGKQVYIYQSKIPLSIRAAEAIGKQKSVFLAFPKSKVALAYENITREVLDHGLCKG